MYFAQLKKFRSYFNYLVAILMVIGSSFIVFAEDSDKVDRWVFELLEKEYPDQITVIASSDKIRIDIPNQRFSVIYLSKPQQYTIMEHRDATYWTFSWPEVAKAAEQSRRNSRKFHYLNIPGFASYDLTQPDSALPSDRRPEMVFDWKQSTLKRDIGAWPCQQWTCATKDSKIIKCWAVLSSNPELKLILERLAQINNQITLSVVRPLWSEWLDRVLDSLLKLKLEPVKVTWGQERELMSFTLISKDWADAKDRWFEPTVKYRLSRPEAIAGLLQGAQE